MKIEQAKHHTSIKKQIIKLSTIENILKEHKCRKHIYIYNTKRTSK